MKPIGNKKAKGDICSYHPNKGTVFEQWI